MISMLFFGGITHRQMRKHLLAAFDKDYILDPHGNAKKKETAPVRKCFLHSLKD
ncbi:MAG: hypothetical protein NT004_05050 [Bacteroidetes bacterium]|nr:hypothetical protein [Bacteroidota bacterium]